MLASVRLLSTLLEPGMRLKLLGIFCLMLVGGGLEMIGLGLFLPFLQLVLDPSRLGTLPVIGDFVAPYMGSDPSSLLQPAALLLLAFYIVKNIFLALLNWINFHFSFFAEARLQQRLLGSYLTAPYEQISGRNTAELIRTVIVSTKSVYKSVMVSCLGLIMESVLAAFAVLTLILIDPRGAITVAVLMGGLVALLYFPLRRFVTFWGSAIQSNSVDLLKGLQQGLGIQKEARVAGREFYFLNAFSKISLFNAKAFTRLQTIQQAPRYASEVIVLSALLTFILLASVSHSSASAALPVLGVFGAAALRLMPSANRIIMHLANIREGRRAIEIVCADLPTQELRESHDVRPIGHASAFNRNLRLENVCYRYPLATHDALQQICLTIDKGSSVALVGPSGAGKSTLADLLLGLLAPKSGQILVDDLPLDVHNPAWRRLLGYVPQHIFLLDDTIRRNIAFGIADADIRESEILRAVEMAGLSEYVKSLPEGLDTVIGERGARLSGGQRQRIGIARALYHQPDLMVFDEATSALDGGTERDVIEAIESLRGKKTLVIIAHRLSTIRHCDTIVLMESGRITDQGRYDALLGRNASFQRLAGLVPA
ncbi:putative Protein glycosylation K [Rhodospirillaceae bacterium LM-1]|nr:putative Protein glycosylation K [Rhodospirillaceae bacterium LM-1]